MKRNRISYNWRHDATYTFIWAIIIATLFVLILQTIIHPGKPIIKPLLAINGLFVPIVTLFIGLRPVLSLFTIPDTLYINDKGQIVTKELEVITNDKIQILEINQVGAGSGHLIYYEMTFNKELSILKNNLFKVITILQSQNDKLEKDKVYLADSLADISHQLKTPLTSMMVMTELLKDESDGKKRAEFLSVTENQLDKMKWLITNLLKLSKLDAGTAEFNIQKISSNDVISQSLKPFLITLDLKNITLKNTAHDFSFNGDFNWSVEAIENIIKNCMEHTDKNGTISISSSHSNIYDEITISDNGCGIAPEDLPHIFERFYQSKQRTGNYGLGLSLAKQLTRTLGGSISVKSTRNATIFTISLPTA